MEQERKAREAAKEQPQESQHWPHRWLMKQLRADEDLSSKSYRRILRLSAQHLITHLVLGDIYRDCYGDQFNSMLIKITYEVKAYNSPKPVPLVTLHFLRIDTEELFFAVFGPQHLTEWHNPKKRFRRMTGRVSGTPID